MPKAQPFIPDGAASAHGCSIAYTDQGIAICFHDEEGVIFAYAMLDAKPALRTLANAQVACMEVLQGVQGHGQVGHA